MRLNIGFDCRILRRADALEVSYTVDNRTGGELGLFNRIRGYRADGGEDYSPDIVYLDLEGDVLHVRKMALPVPAELEIPSYPMIDASRVPAGKSFSETLRIPVPVRVCHPFQRALISGQVVADKPASARRIEVVVGAFPCDEGCALIAEYPAFPDVLVAQPPEVALERQVTMTAQLVLDPPLPVLDYRGVPWPT